ncbi:hypothetical protein FHS96_000954 [Sphingomonas zeicaulis]|uniref:hypothetical protein n=1 Tax=Sphingomonas zeicaulis TaxID=1632740 RepID=UPI003D263ED2
MAAVRTAVAVHKASWARLVPSETVINLEAEAEEEAAYVDMAIAKAELRDHICRIYGLSSSELSALAAP